jgi:hypothetical protein
MILRGHGKFLNYKAIKHAGTTIIKMLVQNKVPIGE